MSTLFVLSGWPIIMYSVYFGVALSLFIRIHSEMFLNSLWTFVSRSSVLLDPGGYLAYEQGRRKHLKLGGTTLRGHLFL